MQPRPVALLRAGFAVVASARAQRVDAAADRFANFAVERNAVWVLGVGAAHGDEVAVTGVVSSAGTVPSGWASVSVQ